MSENQTLNACVQALNAWVHRTFGSFTLKEDQIRTKIEIVVKVSVCVTLGDHFRLGFVEKPIQISAAFSQFLSK